MRSPTAGRLTTVFSVLSWVIGPLACQSTPSPLPAATAADSLQGTWRLLPYPTYPGSDTVLPQFGRAPVGYLVYDATGHVFWQVIRKTAMDSLQLGMRRGVPDSVLLRLSAGFNALFGTYAVDIPQRTVTHHYEGESLPKGPSFEVATPFRLSADSLFIGRDTLTWLRFQRVR